MVNHPALEIGRILVTPLDEREGFVHQVVVMLVAPDEVHVERYNERARCRGVRRSPSAAAPKGCLLRGPQGKVLIQSFSENPSTHSPLRFTSSALCCG